MLIDLLKNQQKKKEVFLIGRRLKSKLKQLPLAIKIKQEIKSFASASYVILF